MIKPRPQLPSSYSGKPVDGWWAGLLSDVRMIDSLLNADQHQWNRKEARGDFTPEIPSQHSTVGRRDNVREKSIVTDILQDLFYILNSTTNAIR